MKLLVQTYQNPFLPFISADNGGVIKFLESVTASSTTFALQRSYKKCAECCSELSKKYFKVNFLKFFFPRLSGHRSAPFF